MNGVSRVHVKGGEVLARFAKRCPRRVVGSANLEEQREVVYLPKVEFVRDDIRLQVLFGSLMEMKADLGKERLPLLKIHPGELESSCALASHSWTIRSSTIDNLAFAEDGFQEGVTHCQAALELVRSIHQEIHRNIAFDQTV